MGPDDRREHQGSAVWHRRGTALHEAAEIRAHHQCVVRSRSQGSRRRRGLCGDQARGACPVRRAATGSEALQHPHDGDLPWGGGHGAAEQHQRARCRRELPQVLRGYCDSCGFVRTSSRLRHKPARGGRRERDPLPAHPSGALTVAQRAPVLAIVLASYLMIVLDISIVITGLPKIRDDLGFSTTSLSWVQNAYTLAFGGLLLLGARAGDILGRRRMLVAGLALFTAASLAIGLAPSPSWLLAVRAVQGVGAAILAPSTLALLTTNFPAGPERTRALAYYAAAAGVGASVGLVLGGIFAGWLSWRVGFFMNVPIGAGLMLGARRCLGETERRPGELDAAGALSSTLGMTALVYGLIRSTSAGWGNLLTLAALTAGVVLLIILVATAVNDTGRSSMAKSPISLRSTPMMRSPLKSPVRPNAGSSKRTTCMRSSADTHSV